MIFRLMSRLYPTVTPQTSPPNPHEPSQLSHAVRYRRQLLFFKERFLPKDHPDRPQMDRLIRPGLTGPHPWRACASS
jgi:hypothetical protein